MHYLVRFVCLVALSSLGVVGCANVIANGGGSGGVGGGPECDSDESCDDGNECTENNCTADSVCEFTPLSDDEPCTDGVCKGGECAELVPCTEAALVQAIDAGGGPYAINCVGSDPVMTTQEIVIGNDVKIYGLGDFIVDAGSAHRVFSVALGVTVELHQITIAGGLVEEDEKGGGIFSDGTLILTDSTVRDSSAYLGAGIYTTGALTLNRSRVSENGGVDNADGSGIYSTGELTLIDTAVSSNGGSSPHAISNYGTMIMITSAVTENSSQSAGVFNVGTATLINSTVSGNNASNNSAITQSSGTLTLINSTVAMGVGFSTIDIKENALLIVSNSLIVARDDEIYTACTGAGRVTSGGGNIESPRNTCGLDGAKGDRFDVSTTALALGELANNGGLTKTHALLAGSEAIDRIAESVCVDADGAPLTTDQRGRRRPAGETSMCDVGAFEVQPQ